MARGGGSMMRALLICACSVLMFLLVSVAAADHNQGARESTAETSKAFYAGTPKQFYLRGDTVKDVAVEKVFQESSENHVTVERELEEDFNVDYLNPCPNNKHDPSVCHNG